MLLNRRRCFCNCGCCCNNTEDEQLECNYEPTGINAQFGYNTANLLDNNDNCGCDQMCCKEKEEMRRKMLKEIQCLKFAITDVALYLNTHRDDRKALCLHREYSQQLKDLSDKYQKMYGPLSIYFPCNSWRWLEQPWPWEGSEE